MSEQDEPETVAGVTDAPEQVPAPSDRPEGITRSEWDDFRREMRDALAAGRTPPPEPEVPVEESVPVAPAPEPAPEPVVPEKPTEPDVEPAEEWGSGLFFRGRRKKEKPE